ncbi:helix-turn-helix domain-containing protein [Bdellovibrio sp. SKB1291214]|uniref:helix-turn-helix domain-containing protein n=1 Tax=Bdellovibrio sp. SKB1291214 TaxID=1732569 RepID=UPI000B51DD4E|nr:helix-turn-helix domain-containing protein [Bdellovibrio sp. SKB1291214]UYL10624.1 helix-turn-helix domain-containing protein [Bdellovibrio sp. SKB1291214]
MKKTGEILKAAREEKGLSLNEVALSLKISSKVLKAIEEGDESQLPAKTFLRGFVKSYATLLRLDADKILESFYEEMGSTRPQPYIRPSTTPERDMVIDSKPEPSEPSEATVTPIRKAAPAQTTPNDYSPLNKKNNTKTIVAIVLLCVLAGLIIFTKKMIDKYSKEAEVPSSQVAQTMEGATAVDGEAPTLTEPMTSQSPTPSNSPLESITKSDSAKPEPITKSTPAPTPSATETAKASPSPSATHTPSPSPTPSVSPSVTASSTATASPSPSASPTPKDEKPKPVELIVEALDTVEIEYSSPNGKPQKIKLSAEQVHTFKSKSGLKINFSNGGAVNLILNGKELGIPGDLGKPIKLSY